MTKYIGLEPTERGNIITYSDTTTSDGIFYQPNDFVGYSHVQGLYPRVPEVWTEKSLLYVVTLFRKSAGGRFDYANKFNRKIASDLRISLPVLGDTDRLSDGVVEGDTVGGGFAGSEPLQGGDGQVVRPEDIIDFEYMESRVRELEESRVRELEEYLHVAGFDDCELTDAEKDTLERWDSVPKGEFRIGEVFTSQTGDTDIQKQHLNGQGEYIVSAGVQNQGIIGNSDIQSKVVAKDTITIDMFGNTFYRDFVYKMVTHARVFALTLKGRPLNREIGLYIVAQLQHLTNRYSYDNMASWEKCKDLYISLPVRGNKCHLSDGWNVEDIDMEYMRLYIRAIEKQTIQRLKEEFLHEGEIYKNVCGVH